MLNKSSIFFISSIYIIVSLIKVDKILSRFNKSSLDKSGNLE